MKVSPDTYMISKEQWGFSTIGIKAEVFKQANDFATSQGKIMITLTFSEKPVAFGRYPTVELQFQVVDKNSPVAVQGTHLVRDPDITIKKDDTVKADVDVRTKEESNKSPDLYMELTKLEDLRKKKILTKEEFQIQKKILLEKQE